MCTGKLKQSLNAIKDLVKVIKPIGLSDRAQQYLLRVAYGKLVMMYYNEYDPAVPSTTKQITTNKSGVLKLLNCFDLDCDTPCSFKFGDDNFIESTPAKLAGLFYMQRIGSRKGQKLLKNFSHKDLNDNVLYNKFFTDIKSTTHQTIVTKTKILEKIKQLMTKRSKSGKRKKNDEKDLVCLIGFYLCCVLFFGDINANGVNVKYLSIVETYETVLKVSWPDLIHGHLFEEIHDNIDSLENVKACVQYLLILFVEHAPEGSIPKVANHEEDIPRVGGWDIYQISDYISVTDMSQFSVSVCWFMFCKFMVIST
ncbi:hypothetical protein MKX03_018972 [Papaver bracteatum]|nr:hypothetical protein MKX03_018972 [Papaver bracteatum]